MKDDKGWLVVILNKTDYIEKLENMVKKGIDKGTYTLPEDNTIKDLKNFKQLLRQNFKGYDKLDNMLPTSNQPARIYASAKAHKFSSVDSANINDLTFRPLTINDTLSFDDRIKRLPPLPDDEEYVSYDILSFFTNIP